MKIGLEQKEIWSKILKDKRVGLIANSASLDKDGNSSFDILKDNVNLCSLFALEHGFFNNIEAGVDIKNEEYMNYKIHSLYHKEGVMLTDEMTDDIDVLVYDIQDLGLRYYTYIASLKLLLKDAATLGLEIVVFDRINPLSSTVRGSRQTVDSFVGPLGLTIQYGLTIGELANYFNKDYNAKLTVVKNLDYTPSLWPDFNRKWIPTSPNIRSFEAAFIYSGLCLLEGTNISEARGTDFAFTCFGTPYMDSSLVIESLTTPGF